MFGGAHAGRKLPPEGLPGGGGHALPFEQEPQLLIEEDDEGIDITVKWQTWMVNQPRRLRVFTIGHSTRELGEVVEMLREKDVDVLCDVRSYPSSRKFPQWYRKSIIENLPSDIGYRWLQDLGGRRYTPADAESPNGAWRVKAFRDYADYMGTDGFRAGLNELLTIATEHTPAIMCSEAVPWRCHRRLITDALLVKDIDVQHIMSPSSTKPAELTEWAVMNEGELTYPIQEK